MAKIEYSQKYFDTQFEYRVVTLPKRSVKVSVPLTESEVIINGIKMSPGWINYAVYPPDNALLFKRKLVV